MTNLAEFNYANDPELRAYLYQQLADIQIHMPEGSNLVVSVFKDDEESPHFVVQLVANVLETQMQVQGEATDIFAAVQDSKDQLVKQLGLLNNAIMNPLEREMEVESIARGNFYLH